MRIVLYLLAALAVLFVLAEPGMAATPIDLNDCSMRKRHDVAAGTDETIVITTNTGSTLNVDVTISNATHVNGVAVGTFHTLDFDLAPGQQIGILVQAGALVPASVAIDCSSHAGGGADANKDGVVDYVDVDVINQTFDPLGGYGVPPAPKPVETGSVSPPSETPPAGHPDIYKLSTEIDALKALYEKIRKLEKECKDKEKIAFDLGMEEVNISDLEDGGRGITTYSDAYKNELRDRVSKASQAYEDCLEKLRENKDEAARKGAAIYDDTHTETDAPAPELKDLYEVIRKTEKECNEKEETAHNLGMELVNISDLENGGRGITTYSDAYKNELRDKASKASDAYEDCVKKLNGLKSEATNREYGINGTSAEGAAGDTAGSPGETTSGEGAQNTPGSGSSVGGYGEPDNLGEGEEPRNYVVERALTPLEAKKRRLEKELADLNKRYSDLTESTRGLREQLNDLGYKHTDAVAASTAAWYARNAAWNKVRETQTGTPEFARAWKAFKEAEKNHEQARAHEKDLKKQIDDLNRHPDLQDWRRTSSERISVRVELGFTNRQLDRANQQETQSGANNYYPSSPRAPSPAVNALSLIDGETDDPITERIARSFGVVRQDIFGDGRLTAWMSGSLSGASGGSQASARNSSGYNVATGFRYRFDPNLSVGLALRYGDSKNKTVDATTAIDSNVYGVALFTDISLAGNTSLRLSGTYQFATNDVTNNGNTGEFDHRTLVLSGVLSRQFTLPGSIIFTPNAGFNWSTTRQDSYTDSGGNSVAAREFEVSVAQYGASFARKWGGSPQAPLMEEAGIASVTGTLAFSGSHFFVRPDASDPSQTNNNPAASSDISTSAGLGFDFVNGTTANLSVGTFFGGSGGERPWSWSGGITVPLAFAPIAGGEGVSLKFGGSYTDLPNNRNAWSLDARVSIPLQ